MNGEPAEVVAARVLQVLRILLEGGNVDHLTAGWSDDALHVMGVMGGLFEAVCREYGADPPAVVRGLLDGITAGQN